MGSNNSTQVTRQREQPTTKEIYAKFYKLCSEGNVTPVARYIDEYNINIYNDQNAAFVIAYVNDHFGLAKWLYHVTSNNSIRIHDNNEAILKHLIDAAPTRIIEWFMSIDKNFDIKQNNNAMFHKLCANNRVSIAKIFQKLCDDYRIEVGLGDNITTGVDCDESDIPENDLKIINYHILEGEITELSILKSLHIIPVAYRKIKNTECPSCLEDYSLVLPCCHTMCVECFYTWYYVKRNYSLCTLCKVKFNYDDCVYIKNPDIQETIIEKNSVDKSVEKSVEKSMENTINILHLPDIELVEDLLIFEDCQTEEHIV